MNCSSEVYENAARIYAEHVLKFSGIRAVYQLGRVNRPGISDLDLIVVLSRETTVPLSSLRVRCVFAGEQNFSRLFVHDVAVFDEDGFAALPLIYHVSNLQLLRGNVLSTHNWPDELGRLASVANLVEFAIPRVHRLGRLLNARVSNRIMALMSLSAIHSCHLLERIGAQSSETCKFLADARLFRNTLDHSTSEHRVREFADYARKTFSLSLLLACRSLGNLSRLTQCAYLQDQTEPFKTVFDDPLQTDMLCGESKTGGRIKTWLRVPSSLYWYFHRYTSAGGVIGAAAKEALKPVLEEPNELDINLYRLLNTRARFLNERYQFLHSLDLQYSDIQVRPGFNIS